jgi:hypothetical protein
MKAQCLIVAGAVAWSAVDINAENPPLSEPRDAALASLASKETEAAVLRGQLAGFEKIRAEATESYQRYENFLKGADESVRKGPIAAQANQQIGRAQLATDQIRILQERLAELGPQIAAAKAQLDRFNKPSTAHPSPFAGNASPRANEPPGGVKVTSGPGYVPEPRPGEKPGLGSSLPDWISTQPPSAANNPTPASGVNPPPPPGGPMVGVDWGLPPAVSPVNPWPSWPPYANPWPTGGGVPGHNHTPAGMDAPSKSGGHKHGADGRDIR